MEKKFDPRGKERKRTNRKKWYKAVCSLAAAVVVCTVYTLMLPALTLDEKSAGDAGVTISESSVPTSGAPSAESSNSDNGSESHNDTAADSSADSSHATTESGPAAAAPSDDRAPSTTNPTTEGEHNAPVTLPTEETNNGAITGSSESHDEVTSPDTDDQEKIKDEENNGSPDADKEEIDEEEADNSGSNTDADTEEDDSEKSDDTADVETASDWETTIPDLSDCETWAEKLLAVARSQLGYHESILNFRVDNKGEHKGYTRYGEWYGNPYGDWCAMFVSFCLNYAGIDKDIVPQNANCNTWMSDLDDRGLFNDAETYVPEEGDIVFFRQHSKTKADHIGIVKEVQLGTKEVTQHFMSNGKSIESGAMNLLSYLDELGIDSDMSVTPGSEEPVLTTETVEVTVAESITVIEGNSADKVNEVTYNLPDDTVLGFVSMGDAEYVHDGGNIDDLKNADQINQPVTLENREMLAAQGISGNNTVEVGKKINITGTNHECHDRFPKDRESWKVSDPSKATIKASGNTATITGVSEGTITVTHTYCTYDWNWYSGYEYAHNSQETKTITITAASKFEDNYNGEALIFYLAEPTGDPWDNAQGTWKPATSPLDKNNIFKANINTTGATWEDGYVGDSVYKNKNIKSNVANYVVSWPDGSEGETWTVKRDDQTTGTYFTKILNQIFNDYRASVANELGLSINEIQKTDITEITVTPRKISRDNGTLFDEIGDYHIDCALSVKCEKVFTVKFWVKEPGSTEYTQVDAKNYKKDSNVIQTTKKTIGDIETFGDTSYVLVGWYNENSTGSAYGDKVSEWPATPTNQELADGTVNYYAHYVAANVKYAVGLGNGSVSDPNDGTKYSQGPETESLFDDNGNPKTDASGSLPKAEEGWVFEGWYEDKDCTKPVNNLDWIDSDTNRIKPVNEDGNWTGVAGNTYYAKFVSGVALPETGGPGTTLLYLLGAMLITAPLTITFIKRRRQEEEEN